jgi:leucyl-tRNA synthetase
MQTNWIGRSEGAAVVFESEAGDEIEIFTTRPDTLWGATFMVLAPEHPLVAKLTRADRRAEVDAYVEQAGRISEIDRQAEGREQTGTFIGAYATNPVNGERIPIWIADYVLVTYGTGAIMAVPYGDQRDFEFARTFDLAIVPVVLPEGVDSVSVEAMSEAHTGPGTVINSGPINGTVHNGGKGRASPAIAAALDHLERAGIGRGEVTYRLRDWLISRQRYWGTPIPILYCDECGIVPEKLENLPVLLPEDVAFMPTGESPLKHHEGFRNAACPSCGGPAQRETDTLDTFMDSSWYWYRYLSPDKSDGPIDPEMVARWTPVATYTGGIEHAILHLMYARFFTKAMRDLGLIDQDEPFARLRNQGMILGADNEKMSKSRGNVTDPDHLVEAYGADTVRTYLMFIGPWDQGGPWNDQGIEGVTRFLHRVWSAIVDPAEGGDGADASAEKGLRRAVHHAIKEVTEDLDDFGFNTAIAELMTLQNAMSRAKSPALAASETWTEACRTITLMLAPFAPHLSEELWQRLGGEGSVHTRSWPIHDPAALVRDTITIAVQVQGKLRGQIEIAADADKETILAAAKAEPNVERHLEGHAIVREIVVPGKLVNLVVRPS